MSAAVAVRLTIKPLFFVWFDFGFCSQSQTFYALKAMESAVRFSEWAHLFSEGYLAQNSASPPAQFDDCPPAKVWPKIYEVAPNLPIGLFRTRNTFRLFYIGACIMGKTRNRHLCKRRFELGTSRRDCGLVPRSMWLLSAVNRSNTDVKAK